VKVDEQDALAALERSPVVVSASEVRAAIDRVSVRISAQLRHKNPVVLCIMQGGYDFHARLCSRLRFPLEVGYLHVGRYGLHTSGGDLTWRAEPTVDVSGRHVLVVDDVLDRGDTLRAVLDAMDRTGAASVKSAVLVEKDVTDIERPRVDFVALHCPNEYLFGCGMDFQGYWRNLTEIRALPAEMENHA